MLDTGASWTVTPFIRDFVDTIEPADLDSLRSLDGNIAVHGMGPIELTIQDMDGIIRTIRTQALYVPTAEVRLFSPQSFFMENKGGSLTCCHKKVVLTLPDGCSLTFPWQLPSKLPYMLTTEMLQSKASAKCYGFTMRDLKPPLVQPAAYTHALPNILDPSNLNLTGSQKELLLWHQRLGHCDMSRIQALFGVPRDNISRQVLFPSNPRMTTCTLPKCEACQYAKQKRRLPPSKRQEHRPSEEGVGSDDILLPGQKVSCDLYTATIPGRLPHTAGKEKSDIQYAGGAIFVDVATRLVFIHHQPNLTAAFAVISKHAFERFADGFGITIKEYLSDNQPFSADLFRQDCTNQNQSQSFSGVGSQHQNRVERSVQTIFNWARALLLHFTLHWPAQAQLNLWPFALDYAVWLWNNIPDLQKRLSPLELFASSVHQDYKLVQRARVFGCPVYVLDPKLQDGKKLPKWSKRSRMGIFVGFSSEHSNTVALVLNIESGHISPQYHLVFDERFSTVSRNPDDSFTPDEWLSLLDSGYDRHTSLEAFEDENGNPVWNLPPDLAQQWIQRRSIVDASTQAAPPPTTTSSAQTDADDPAVDASTQTKKVTFDSLGTQTDTTTSLRRTPTDATTSLRRSARRTNPPSRFHADYTAVHRQRLGFLGNPGLSKQTTYRRDLTLPKIRGEQLNQQRLAALDWDNLVGLCRDGTYGALLTQHTKNSPDGFVESLNPALFATKANADDNPTWNEAMNGPQAAGFWEACKIEIDALISKDCWEVVPRPTHRPVVSSTWAFKIKRFPDGLLRKLKARFCARGYEQTEGVDYHETFAPVVSWTTVRFLLMVSILLNLETRQVDYLTAFTQSPIDTEVYIEMPRGFGTPGKVLRLKKSLYGLKQSPRNYYQHLRSKLEDIGFKACAADPCLFVTDRVVCLVYVDDTLFYARDKTHIDDVVAGLRSRGMDLEEEADVAGFLGVLIDRRDDGSIQLTQKGLIKRILSALNIDHLPTKQTPAKLGVLGSAPEGAPPNGTFSYPSVIGMMQYLQANSRPDIAFAVAQCARFMHNTKRSHEEALERIGQYLKATQDQGLILKPKTFDTEFQTDVYVDADFAGAWGFEDPGDPSCVKSRTGFIVEIMGCPVQWVSKLQTDIATSTMESEYSALSMALRAAIPLLQVCKYVITNFSITNKSKCTFKTTVHEDNQGAMKLAKMEPGRNTPRSKFYAIKHHWFRSWLKPNEIEIEYIESKQQKADFLTKSLPMADFERNRMLSCGW